VEKTILLERKFLGYLFRINSIVWISGIALICYVYIGAILYEYYAELVAAEIHADFELARQLPKEVRHMYFNLLAKHRAEAELDCYAILVNCGNSFFADLWVCKHREVSVERAEVLYLQLSLEYNTLIDEMNKKMGPSQTSPAIPWYFVSIADIYWLFGLLDLINMVVKAGTDVIQFVSYFTNAGIYARAQIFENKMARVEAVYIKVFRVFTLCCNFYFSVVKNLKKK
jgi:hypothetical protein